MHIAPYLLTKACTVEKYMARNSTKTNRRAQDLLSIDIMLPCRGLVQYYSFCLTLDVFLCLLWDQSLNKSIQL